MIDAYIGEGNEHGPVESGIRGERGDVRLLGVTGVAGNVVQRGVCDIVLSDESRVLRE